MACPSLIHPVLLLDYNIPTLNNRYLRHQPIKSVSSIAAITRHRHRLSQRPLPAALRSVLQSSFLSCGTSFNNQLNCREARSRKSSTSFVVNTSAFAVAPEKTSAGESVGGEDGAAVGPARTLYPAKSSYRQGRVKVSDLHTVYYEVFGNPKGQPVVFLHGGPGAGCYPNHSRFFDLTHYRVLLFDQRGCGKSTPRGCLIENTTWDLVSDIEKLREELGVEKWLVCGGSWGVTLALAYVQSHPKHVAALVLRGVCLLRQSEIDWFYKQGASSLFPFGWQQLLSAVDPSEHDDLIPAFYERLTSGDQARADAAARAWLRWEMGLSFFQSSPGVYAWDGKDYSLIPSPLVAGSASPPPAKASGPTPPAANGNPPPVADPSSKGSTAEPAPPPSGGSEATAAPPAAATPDPSSRPEVQTRETLTGPTAVSGPLQSSRTAAEAALRPAEGIVTTEPTSKESASAVKQGPPKEENSSVAPPGEEALNGGSGGGVPVTTGGRDLAGSPSMSSTLVQARLECHYFLNRGFLREGQLLAGVDAIRGVPCIIVQGRFDFVCPLVNAFDLHRAWQEAELRVVPNAGHSMYEPGIVHEIVSATDRLRSLHY